MRSLTAGSNFTLSGLGDSIFNNRCLPRKVAGAEHSTRRLLWAGSHPERVGRSGGTTFSRRCRPPRRAWLSSHALSKRRSGREVQLGLFLRDDPNGRFFAVERTDLFEPLGHALFHFG
jgi:hypothetical protein